MPPYAVSRKGTKGYQVVDTGTGEVKAVKSTKVKADRVAELLRSIDRNWQASGEANVYVRRVNGKRVKLRVKTGGQASGKTQRRGTVRTEAVDG